MAFLTELGNPYDAIGVDTNGRTSMDWGVYGVPETFVVNAEGVITYKHIGPITEQSLRGGSVAGDREGQGRLTRRYPNHRRRPREAGTTVGRLGPRIRLKSPPRGESGAFRSETDSAIGNVDAHTILPLNATSTALHREVTP